MKRILMVVFGAVLGVAAADYTWINSMGGAWTNGSAWSPAAFPPLNSDTAFLTPQSNKVFTLERLAAVLSLGSLGVDSTAGDGSPVILKGEPLFFAGTNNALRTVSVAGELVVSNQWQAWNEFTLNGGKLTLTQAGGEICSSPRWTVNKGELIWDVADRQTVLSNLLASAWMHLDPSVEGSLETFESGGVQYVRKWNDVRPGTNLWAVAPRDTNSPILKKEGFNYVDFGLLTFFSGGTPKTMIWNVTNREIRSVFIVYSDQATGLKQNIIGRDSSGIGLSFFRGNGGQIFNATTASINLLAGETALNRQRVSGGATVLPAGFNVISIISTGNGVDGNAFSRDAGTHAGGSKIAEVIVFNRVVSTPERRILEGYLYSKWIKADSGNSQGYGAQLALASNTVLTAKQNIRFQHVKLAGIVSKGGTGTLSAERFEHSTGKLTVSSGGLHAAAPLTNTAVIPTPWMRLDASAAASMDIVAQNGTNFVSVWRDADGRTTSAAVPAGAARPYLAADGELLQSYLEFGPLAIGNANGPNMLWNATNNTIRTVVMVYADNPADPRACILGNWGGTGMQFYRGSSRGLLSLSQSAAAVQNGRIQLDGFVARPEVSLNPGFHLISIVTVGASGCAALSRDLNVWTGGTRYGELIVWNEALTEDQLAAVEQSLMKKWFGKDRLGFQTQSSEPQIASGSWMHLDVQASGSLETAAEGNSTYVTRWNDVNGNGRYVYAPTLRNRPLLQTVDSVSCVDMGVLTYGSMNGIPDGRHLVWSETNQAVRTVFLIFRDSETSIGQHMLGWTGANNAPFGRGYNRNLLYSGAGVSLSALDGTSCDFTTTIPDFSFHLVALRLSVPRQADAFARFSSEHAGGYKLAEAVIYDRSLSDSEFQQTSDYLSRKWFQRPLPGASDSYLATLEADTLPVTVDTNKLLLCQNLTATTVVKKGPGRLVATTATIGQLTVEDGVVEIRTAATLSGLSGTGGVDGNLTLNGTLTCGATPLVVDGALTFGTGAQIVAEWPQGMPSGPVVLLKATAVSGTFSLPVPANLSYTVATQFVNGELQAVFRLKATLIRVY